MIAQILAAVGLVNPLESDSHTAREAAHAAHAAERVARIEARKQAALYTEQQALIADTAAEKAALEKLAATRARLAKSLASKARETLAPMFVEFVKDASRKVALEIGNAVHALDLEAHEKLGQPIWDRTIYHALSADFVAQHPGLMHEDAAQTVVIGHSVLLASTPGPTGALSVPVLLDALLAVERHIERAIQNHRHAPDARTVARYAHALAHACRTDFALSESKHTATVHRAGLDTAPQSIMHFRRAGQLLIGRPSAAVKSVDDPH